MPIELEVRQLQEEVREIRLDLAEVGKFIKGNGDPTKGLLWLVADLGRLSAAQAEMVGSVAKALEKHKTDDHHRRQGAWTRLGFIALGQAAGSLVLVIFFLVALGFLDYVRSGRVP